VQLEAATVAALGGRLNVGAFSVALAKPEFSVAAEAVGLDASQMLFLVPEVLAEARGRLDGRIQFRRDAAGIQIGAGRLALPEGETATLRLVPRPGLLSGSIPPSVLRLYPGLAKMETGGIPLQADSLEVAFTPGGDASGRTASVRLTGGPADPSIRAPLDLTVNVRGPLESLVQFGADSRLRFGGAR
jgi:hypothetical protein